MILERVKKEKINVNSIYPDLESYIIRFVALGKHKTGVKWDLQVYKNILMKALITENRVGHTEEDGDKDIHENAEVIKAILKEFECPVCFDIMLPPKKIGACSKDHYLCGTCIMSLTNRRCPECREDFNRIKPTRRRKAEKIIEKLKDSAQKLQASGDL